MIIDAIDRKIRDAFSNAALHYDVLSSLHKEIGRELTKKIIGHDPCKRILDIGMGTGWFTKRLTNCFPDATVVGIDFARGMVDSAAAKEASFKVVQADALHLPFKAGVFDIITSNLAYQWVGNLKGAFEHCRSALTPTGTLCFTMFGRETFGELFAALEHCLHKNDDRKALAIDRLATADQVKESLSNAGFKECTVSSELIKVRFADMLSLVKWIKEIGANALSKDLFIGKELLNRTNEYYNGQYRDRLGVFATFEVIWVEAKA